MGGWRIFFLTWRQYFSYIVVVSFIGGGNRSTWRKPPTCRKSHISWARLEPTTLLVIGTDCIGPLKLNWNVTDACIKTMSCIIYILWICYIFVKSLYHSTSCTCCRRDSSSQSTVLLRPVVISLVPAKMLYFYFEYDE